MSKTSIVRINEYESLYGAIDKAIKLVGDFNLKEKNVLLKPNCLMDSKDAITAPIVLGTIVKWVK
ncbi:MAG: hypothetical protein EU549_04035, partial [Promethearchaeota archaeon]